MNGEADTEALLAVSDLVVKYRSPRSLFHLAAADIHAVNGVSLDIAAGQTLGLVGESGSGKSSTGNTILGIVRAESGSVRFDGVELTTLEGKYPQGHPPRHSGRLSRPRFVAEPVDGHCGHPG